mmetsp:Transcript_17027/g.25552  ORF Transcript_17027/g.25552 Transcript_17027/m.25552 type:complete len:92 (-) Transcript_17027:201-476(-)
MWQGLSCVEWGAISGIFIFYYLVLTGFLAIFLVAEFEEGLDTLWAFFAIFCFFAFCVAFGVIYFEIKRYQNRKQAEVEKKRKMASAVVKHH